MLLKVHSVDEELLATPAHNTRYYPTLYYKQVRTEYNILRKILY